MQKKTELAQLPNTCIMITRNKRFLSGNLIFKIALKPIIHNQNKVSDFYNRLPLYTFFLALVVVLKMYHSNHFLMNTLY